MVQHSNARDLDKIETLANAVKNDKDRIDKLCREFDAFDLKSHKSNLVE